MKIAVHVNAGVFVLVKNVPITWVWGRDLSEKTSKGGTNTTGNVMRKTFTF